MSDIFEAARLISEWDNILVLSHASPDGDTLGSATALLRGLISLGKKVAFKCADDIGHKYSYLFDGLDLPDFEPLHIVSVDVADPVLLGKLCDEYKDKVELAIDHHGTHVDFGKTEWTDPTAAATCQMIYKLLLEMRVDIDVPMADCLYTGISTDTGCFRYSNATAETHRAAAEIIELGANYEKINRIMFDTKTKACIDVEREVLKNMEFFYDDKIALISIPVELIKSTGAHESDLEGLPSIARGIEGVQIGITMKEKEGGVWKASVRTTPPVDASAICQSFGGGGHKGAAGCAFDTDFIAAKNMLVDRCEKYLSGKEL